MTRTATRLAILTTASLISSSVYAQSAAPAATPAAPATAPAEARGSTDIIVTAQKREQNINKVGLTITALGAGALEERNIQSAQDIAQAVPGLSYTESANNTPVYTLRGVGFYDTSLGSYPTTSVYLDQVPLPFPILTSLTAFDLERIEVLKGPQGTLFGQNSTGGAINYIAAKPTDTFSAGIEGSYGRFDGFRQRSLGRGPTRPHRRARRAQRPMAAQLHA
jgi:iron complex outermembrane receptor protein